MVQLGISYTYRMQGAFVDLHALAYHRFRIAHQRTRDYLPATVNYLFYISLYASEVTNALFLEFS
jgi:hypothetical protein